MDNPSGFVGYGQWAGLNQAAEEEMMQQALERAQAQQEDADRLLSRAGYASLGVTGSPGNGQALSTQADYGEYLKARQQALGAYSAVTGPTGSPWEDSLRQTANPTLVDKAHAGASGTHFDDLEKQWAERLAQRQSGQISTPSTPVPGEPTETPEQARAASRADVRDTRFSNSHGPRDNDFRSIPRMGRAGNWDAQDEGGPIHSWESY